MNLEKQIWEVKTLQVTIGNHIKEMNVVYYGACARKLPEERYCYVFTESELKELMNDVRDAVVCHILEKLNNTAFYDKSENLSNECLNQLNCAFTSSRNACEEATEQIFKNVQSD